MDAPDSESSSQTCVGCGRKSPPTDTDYTLISSRHGWRLTIETSPNGRRHPIWRCPACWRRRRDAEQVTSKLQSSMLPPSELQSRLPKDK